MSCFKQLNEHHLWGRVWRCVCKRLLLFLLKKGYEDAIGFVNARNCYTY